MNVEYQMPYHRVKRKIVLGRVEMAKRVGVAPPSLDACNKPWKQKWFWETSWLCSRRETGFRNYVSKHQ